MKGLGVLERIGCEGCLNLGVSECVFEVIDFDCFIGVGR